MWCVVLFCCLPLFNLSFLSITFNRFSSFSSFWFGSLRTGAAFPSASESLDFPSCRSLFFLSLSVLFCASSSLVTLLFSLLVPIVLLMGMSLLRSSLDLIFLQIAWMLSIWLGLRVSLSISQFSLVSLLFLSFCLSQLSFLVFSVQFVLLFSWLLNFLFFSCISSLFACSRIFLQDGNTALMACCGSSLRELALTILAHSGLSSEHLNAINEVRKLREWERNCKERSKAEKLAGMARNRSFSATLDSSAHIYQERKISRQLKDGREFVFPAVDFCFQLWICYKNVFVGFVWICLSFVLVSFLSSRISHQHCCLHFLAILRSWTWLQPFCALLSYPKSIWIALERWDPWDPLLLIPIFESILKYDLSKRQLINFFSSFFVSFLLSAGRYKCAFSCMWSIIAFRRLLYPRSSAAHEETSQRSQGWLCFSRLWFYTFSLLLPLFFSYYAVSLCLRWTDMVACFVQDRRSSLLIACENSKFLPGIASSIVSHPLFDQKNLNAVNLVSSLRSVYSLRFCLNSVFDRSPSFVLGCLVSLLLPCHEHTSVLFLFFSNRIQRWCLHVQTRCVRLPSQFLPIRTSLLNTSMQLMTYAGRSKQPNSQDWMLNDRGFPLIEMSFP